MVLVILVIVVVVVVIVVVVVVMVTPDPAMLRGSVAVPDSRLLNMLVVVSLAGPSWPGHHRGVTGTTTCYPHHRQSVSQCCHRQWGTQSST